MGMNLLEKTAQHVARSPLKKAIYPFVDGVLAGIGRLNAQGYDLEQTILVACTARGGSTWLAEIVAALQEYVILWEPLHLVNNPRCEEAGFRWQNYFAEDDDCRAQKEYLRRVYAGADLSTRTLTSLEFSPSDLVDVSGYVVKHVNANMMLHRIMEWFPVRAVLMIRHPCAVVASQLNHGGWGHLNDENTSLSDTLAAEFPHLRRVYNGLDTIEEFLAFKWAVRTRVPLSQPTPHPWCLTTYERLVVVGEQEVERIFSCLGEPTPEGAVTRLDRPSATAGETPNVRKGESRLDGWTEQLTPEQVNRILQTVRAVGVTCYDESLTPDEEALPFRSGDDQRFES